MAPSTYFIGMAAIILSGIALKKTSFLGGLATAAAVAGLVASVKKTVIDPIDKKEAMIEENRKKAMRQ